MKNKPLRSKNRFGTEVSRNELAKGENLSEFKDTYSSLTNKNSNTQKFWDGKFEAPDRIENQDEMTKEKIDFIISQLPKEKVKILDLGIGQGYLEQRLKQLKISYEIYGIDISKTSIQRSKKNYKGNFLVGDILNINKNYKNNFFDVVVAIEVIEHVLPNDIFGLYEKVYKILKPKGLFIISTPLNEGLTSSSPNPSAHVRQYTVPIIKMEFKIARFKIKRYKTFFAFNKFYLLKKSLSKLIQNKWKPNNVVIVAEKN